MVLFLILFGTEGETARRARSIAVRKVDPRLAVHMLVNSPAGVVVDPGGDLYIAESQSHQVRRVVASTGFIEPVAGTGFAAHGGDGGPATSAQLNFPAALALDAGGNLFIADQFNHRVRRVAAGTGIITTVAGTGARGSGGDGGPATSAQLNFPAALALDAGGNLFIADQFNHRVRGVAAGTGIITTVAGTGEPGFAGDGRPARLAQVSFPSGLVVDAGGNLFIADRDNQRIRKVAGVTAIITTVAGTGVPGLSGDNGPSTSAQLFNPHGLAQDGGGNLFVADRDNHRVRRIEAATGAITTVAGAGPPVAFGQDSDGDRGPATEARLSRPIGLYADVSGNLYIADTEHNRVRKISAGTGLITTVAGGGGLGAPDDDRVPMASALVSHPAALAFDRNGALLFIQGGGHRVRTVDFAAGLVTTVAGTGGRGFGGDGRLATEARLDSPTTLVFDASGNLFIADGWNRRIRKVDSATGRIATVAGTGVDGEGGDGGPATSAQLRIPLAMVFDGTGNLFIADDRRIRKIATETGIITTVAGGGNNNPGDGGPATSAHLSYPSALAVDAEGNLFVGEGRRVRRVAAGTGIITTVAGGGKGRLGEGGSATKATLSASLRLALDTGGNLFISDRYSHRIHKVDGRTGIITTVAGTGEQGFEGDGGVATKAKLNQPGDIAFDREGNLYVADTKNNRIRKVAARTRIITTVAGTGPVELDW